MKYRRLVNEELQELQSEFVTFLASNQVTAGDWEKIKENSPERVESLIGMFSDIVFDKILKQVDYLELKSPNEMRLFRLFEEKIEMIGLRMEGESNLDFTQQLAPAQMMQELQQSDAKLQMYAAERSYKKERNIEAFELMQQGALISKDGALFKTLHALKK